MSKEETPIKDLDYYKSNAEEDYIKTPISVLRYITELENNTQAKVSTLEEALRECQEVFDQMEENSMCNFIEKILSKDE